MLDPKPVSSLPEDAVVYHTVTLKTGVQFDVALDPTWTDPITDAVATGQTWFLDDCEYVLARLQPGDTVVDLGGHVGTFALAAAALGCRVLCVEAAPTQAQLIETSARRNGFASLRVVHAAVTDRAGTLEFFPNGPWGTIANAAVAHTPGMIQASTLSPVVVPAVTVDALLERAGWDRVDVVKVDVEGAEVEAIGGMARLLARPDAPLLLYESNAHTLGFFDHGRDAIEAALQEHGYACFDIEPGRLLRWQPGRLEPRCTVNRLAVKGEPPVPDGWRLTGPRDFEETVQRVVDAAASAHAVERAYTARALAVADPAIRADPRVRSVLNRFGRDEDEAVRAAAAW